MLRQSVTREAGCCTMLTVCCWLAPWLHAPAALCARGTVPRRQGVRIGVGARRGARVLRAAIIPARPPGGALARQHRHNARHTRLRSRGPEVRSVSRRARVHDQHAHLVVRALPDRRQMRNLRAARAGVGLRPREQRVPLEPLPGG
eukprot:2414618-Rhodomonas_salina.1